MRVAMLCGVLALAAPARADDIVRGAVVKAEHEEIYVNLGAAQGLATGTPLRIKRTITLRHPVTRAQVRDWIPIGTAVVAQVGNKLTRVVVGELIEDIKLGDVVEALVDTPDAPPPAPAPEPAPTPTPAPEPAKPAVDPHTAAVLAVFAGQSGLALDARIARWERYLSKHGSSPYAAAVREDVAQLHALRDELALDAAAFDERVEELDHSPPITVRAGGPIALVFVMPRPQRVASAYLHYRKVGARTYTRVLLSREHEIYLRGSISGDAVHQPGVEYFVEVSLPNGHSGIALGSPPDPIRVAVRPGHDARRFADSRGRTSVAVGAEFLHVGMFDDDEFDAQDSIFNATLDVSYDVGGAVQRIGVGYGVYTGEGGVRDLGLSGNVPFAGYHYGAADLELGRQDLAFGSRLFAGVGTDGFGLGIEGRGRIGRRDATNLGVVARTLPAIGWVFDVRFGTRPSRVVGLGIIVGAMNQPTQGDVAAKLATELEWVGSDRFSLLVRGSWQGRSTQHSGFGGGAAVGIKW